ncbi:His Kinase A (phospho-acceptor) domain-containing protein [Hymenobacter daecheongensis DSM 21074]|uniref:histidine kinase n=1 Tax=Hymenobacter daecheongensis DSM 21074 TaxID=1121955 RepID=A0A1M6GQ74_9BACT|nr:CHASE3 domain-containing protein [Hymenobacter daecheongensis]SHJ12111.1 His Kinase A (phospho-acceptor) domain-containing protein [Hymenobacter daecheongensis DSM 21074]
MRLKLNTKILLGFAVAAAVLLLTSIVSYRSIRQLTVHTKMVEHTYQVLQAAEHLTSQVREAEWRVRGYLLTNDADYLQNYGSSRQKVEQSFRRLAQLTADNPAQIERLDSMQVLVLRQFANMQTLIRPRQALTPSSMRTILDTGRQTMRAINGLFERIKSNEMALLTERNRQQTLYETIAPITIIVSAVLAILITLWLFFKISRELTANEQLQAQLVLTNQETARRIEIVEHLAAQVLAGDYKVKIKDKEQDSLGNLAGLLNRMTQRLDESFGALENRNKELDQFAYVASHDLKAPLRGVMTIVKWIDDELSAEISPQLRQYLDMMKGRLARLEDLINGLLAYARIGRTGQKIEQVDVQQLVSEVTEMVVPAAFQVTIADPLPTLLTDRLSLQQVFTNLFSNAVKYHHLGTGTITVRCHEGKKDYEFTVADDGPGIAPEYHEKIFLMFQTLRDRHTAESTGIGLSIVKKIIDEQKGSMRVNSAVGQGAAFIFTWPKAAANDKVA